MRPEIRIGDGTARTSMVVHPTSQKRDVGHPAPGGTEKQIPSLRCGMTTKLRCGMTNERSWRLKKESHISEARCGAPGNAGILRCAQNDSREGSGLFVGAARAQARAEGGEERACPADQRQYDGGVLRRVVAAYLRMHRHRNQ